MEQLKSMNNEEKEKMIKEEITKLSKFLTNVSKDRKIFTDRLIEQAAFMYATLHELQLIMNENGSIDLFKNGAQVMNRESPASKLYNNTIKNYIAVIKQLAELIPNTKENKDELYDFLKKVK